MMRCQLFARWVTFVRHLNFPTLWAIMIHTFQQRLPGLAAEMTYHLMLSLFPALLTCLAAIGLFDVLHDTFWQLMGELSPLVPADVSQLLQSFFNEVGRNPSQELFSLSFLVSFWTASSGISAGMYALDQIHQIPPAQTRPFWRAKCISLLLTLGTVLWLIAALAVVFTTDLVVQFAVQHIGGFTSYLLQFWQKFSLPLALALATLAIALIYRFGPSRWQRGIPVLPGAIFAAITWVILSNGFRLYVSYFGNYNQVYGAVGGFVVLQLWLYLSSFTLLLGSQVNVTVGTAMHPRRNSLNPHYRYSK